MASKASITYHLTLQRKILLTSALMEDCMEQEALTEATGSAVIDPARRKSSSQCSKLVGSIRGKGLPRPGFVVW